MVALIFSPFPYLFYFTYYVFACVWIFVCHAACVEVRGKFMETGSEIRTQVLSKCLFLLSHLTSFPTIAYFLFQKTFFETGSYSIDSHSLCRPWTQQGSTCPPASAFCLLELKVWATILCLKKKLKFHDSLIPVILAIKEAEAGTAFEFMRSRSAWATQWDPFPNQNKTFRRKEY